MAYLPLSAPINAKYTITGPTGVVAVLNDSTDGNWVGDTTEVTGLDSPDIRENADDVVEGDGGIHGNFYYGRRPITLSGNIKGHTTLVGREIKEDKLGRATQAMRGDTTLAWTAPSGAAVRVLCRRQVPLRFTGGWFKEFQVGLVSASHLIEGQTLNLLTSTAGAALGSAGQTLTPENQGSAIALPTDVRIWGPITGAELVNASTGQTMIKLTGSIANGSSLYIDFKNKTVGSTGVGSADQYALVDFLGTAWDGVSPGVNSIYLGGSGGGAATQWRLNWRSSWV